MDGLAELSWSFEPAWLDAVGGRDAAVGPAGLRLGEWLADGRAKTVKQTPHRGVYRVVLPAADFHVKLYWADGRERWRRLLRGGKARREAAITREVARRGVPTLDVVGVGEAPRWGGAVSCLLTRTLPDAVPLPDFLDGPLITQPAVRQGLAEALGAFLAGKHRAGVRHDDLNVGNLLVRVGADGIAVHLIDLHAVRLGGPLSWRAARANLVVLDRYFLPRGVRTDRRRALQAYCRARPELGIDARAAAGAIHQESRTSFIRYCTFLDGRVGGANRHYRRLRSGPYRGAAVSELCAAELAALLADPDAPFDRPGARVLKRSRSSAVVEVELSVGGRTRSVILKRFDATSWDDPLRALFREPAAAWSFRMGHSLRGRGLPTPRPLAVWHRHRAGLPGDGYLLVDRVPDAVPLHHHVRAGLGRARLRRLIDECARLMRQMHERGLSHRDLKAANLLVSPQGWSLGYRGLREEVSGDEHVWLIDLVGVRRHAEVGERRRMRDLARLHVSFLDDAALTRTDRLRFLRTYLAWGLAGRDGWKGWWKQVDEAARAKARRNRQRGRVVG